MVHHHLNPLTIVREIYETSRTVRRHFNRRARSHGFTQGQWQTLWLLERNEGISQAGLADILEMQPIAVARILTRMEKTGLIERTPDPSDKRIIQLSITPRALPILKILHNVGDEIQMIANKGLTEEEQRDAIELLIRIRSNFGKAEAKLARKSINLTQTSRPSP